MEREPGFYWMQWKKSNNAHNKVQTIGEWSGYSWDVIGLHYFGIEDEVDWDIKPSPIENPFL